MCGLVGIYSSNMLQKHKDALAALLYLDTWRGRDSTGVAAIRHNADTSILKSTVPGYEFVEGPRLGEHLKLNDFCWIGHNRLGTVGKNIKSNAHPFDILDEDGSCLLVGAHNGTLKNKWDLPDHARFGTDSEALYNSIAVKGLEETIKKTEGAWALSWYDHVEEELRFLRNKERTLFYAFEKGKKTLIWASEMWMIRVACSRSGIELEEDKVYAFAEDTLYRFPVPLNPNEELTMHRKGGLVGKTPPFFQRWGRERWTGGQSGHGATHTQTTTTPPKGSQASTTALATASSSQSGTGSKSDGEKQTPKSEDSSTPVSNVRNILSAKVFKGFNGVLLSKRELDDQLANGCGWCELEFITPEDRYAWIAPGKPVCMKCLKGEPHEEKDEDRIVSASRLVH